MARRPLRPLARIIPARDRGEDPDKAEAKSRLAKARARRAAEYRRAEIRLMLVAGLFVFAFLTIAGRMALFAVTAAPPPNTYASDQGISSERSDIVDRNGNVLATNVHTRALYAHPPEMVDPDYAAERLARIFPDLDADKLKRRFAPPAKFVWVKRRVSPEQAQAVHDIGDPGLHIGRRQARLYPNGKVAAHVLGGAGFGREGVQAAEVVGRAGVEQWFDARLRAPNASPLQLSIDLGVQVATREVLEGGIKLMGAKSGSAVLLDAHTGEVLSLVSLPDFDPNFPPRAPKNGDPADSPLFNRAAQGLFELGSSYKLFTAAIALESGIAGPDTLVDTKPMKWGRYRIKEFGGRDYSPFLSLAQVMIKSSNIGSARLALEFGRETQKAMLERLGMLAPSPIEMPEAASAKPIYPKRWSDIHTITISYGHGLSASPMHLAAAYATLTNGGIYIRPTLLKRLRTPEVTPHQIISAKNSERLRNMLREVVVSGTAKMANVPGYRVGGKTGTAVKPKKTGGYYDDKVIANFASVFPVDDPQYVLVVTLDEPEDTVDGKPKRTAGWTAAPIAAEIIRRTAPILNVRPRFDTARLAERDRAG